MKKKKKDKYFLKEIIISKIICPVIFEKKNLKIIEGKNNNILQKMSINQRKEVSNLTVSIIGKKNEFKIFISLFINVILISMNKLEIKDFIFISTDYNISKFKFR